MKKSTDCVFQFLSGSHFDDFFSFSFSHSHSLTYRRNKCGREGIVREAKQYAGLANTGVADEQQLEQQIVRLLRHFVAEAIPRQGVDATVEEEINRAKRLLTCNELAMVGLLRSAATIFRNTLMLRTSNVMHRL